MSESPKGAGSAVEHESGAMLRTLVVGADGRYEFAAAAEVLRRRSLLIECGSLDEALRLRESHDFGLIVVAEALPGRYSANEPAALRRGWPTTPIVRLCGPWCDGEGRSRRPPPGFDLPWSAAAVRLGRDFDALARGECPSWGEPATLSEEDRVLRTMSPISSTDLANRSVAIAVDMPALGAWLFDVLAPQCARVIHFDWNEASLGEPIDVVLWQPTNSTTRWPEQLAALRKQCPQARLAALCGFVRPEEAQRLKEFSVEEILDIPLDLAGLEAAVAGRG